MKLLRVFFLILVSTVLFSIYKKPSAHGVAVIRMTAEGFEPREVTVDQNSVVRFINEDDEDRWPASNLHPTHELYPQFDPQKAIAPGKFWTFRPKETGTWKFHDHLIPHMRGTLTVTPETSIEDLENEINAESKNPLPKILKFFSEIFRKMETSFGNIFSYMSTPTKPLSKEESVELVQSKMSECMHSNGANNCYKKAAQAMTLRMTPEEIMKIFSENEQKREIFMRCHEVTHYLGRKLYEREKSVGQAYGKCMPTCWGGCYHGVLEQDFNNKGIVLGEIDEEIVKKNVATVCDKRLSDVSRRLYAECLHGIGHAMMFITDGDLPRSLVYCDSLSDTQNRETCYGGAFMENSSSSTNLDHPSKFIKADDPMYPCNILDSQYLNVCYRYQSSHFSIISGHDWNKVVDLCLQIPDQYQPGCFNIMGSNQIGFTQDYDVMIQNCNLVKTAHLHHSCISGAASGLGGRYVGDPSKMIEFCARLSTSDKSMCYGALQGALNSWGTGREQKSIFCNQVKDKEFIDYCMGNQPPAPL